MVLPKDLTPVEEYLLKKFALLKKKKKALQKIKETADAAKSVKPGIKRAAPEQVHPPEDAKEIAKKLIASGTVKIKKDNLNREFKRTKSESRKIREGQQGARSTQSSSKQQDNAQRTPVKDLYDSFVPAGRRGSDAGSRDNHSYDHRERKRGKMIFVSGSGLNENILKSAFNEFGTVERTHFEREKGHGFVTFDSCDAADKAIDEMNGFMVSGVIVKVALARRQPNLDESHSHGRGSHWGGSRDGRGGPSDPHLQERRQLVVYDDEI